MIQEIKNNFFHIQYTEIPHQKELYDYSINLKELNKMLQEKFSVILEESSEDQTKESHNHVYSISSTSLEGEITPENWVDLKTFLKENIDDHSFNFIETNISTYKYQVIIEVKKII